MKVVMALSLGGSRLAATTESLESPAAYLDVVKIDAIWTLSTSKLTLTRFTRAGGQVRPHGQGVYSDGQTR
jgi:hypothetical protein